MSSTSTSKPIQHGFSILRLVTDDRRGDSVPVGVVAWDSSRSWFAPRILDEDEAVPGVTKAGRQFLQIALGQLLRWASSSSVPYAPDELSPSTARFWSAAGRVMTTAVRLDEPRAMDPLTSPDEEIEALFEALVQPRQSKKRRANRVDGAISRALGTLADVVPRSVDVTAFHGAREQVRRGLVTDNGVLLVDGVNLATTTARHDADALVSRFLRIHAAYPQRVVKMIVGYTASPGGLNGEAHMREWIRERLTEDVFDLVNEQSQFRMATAEAWEVIESQPQGKLL